MNTVPVLECIAYHSREAEIEMRLASQHKRHTFRWTKHMKEYDRHCDEVHKLRSGIQEARLS